MWPWWGSAIIRTRTDFTLSDESIFRLTEQKYGVTYRSDDYGRHDQAARQEFFAIVKSDPRFVVRSLLGRLTESFAGQTRIERPFLSVRFQCCLSALLSGRVSRDDRVRWRATAACCHGRRRLSALRGFDLRFLLRRPGLQRRVRGHAVAIVCRRGGVVSSARHARFRLRPAMALVTRMRSVRFHLTARARNSERVTGRRISHLYWPALVQNRGDTVVARHHIRRVVRVCRRKIARWLAGPGAWGPLALRARAHHRAAPGIARVAKAGKEHPGATPCLQRTPQGAAIRDPRRLRFAALAPLDMDTTAPDTPAPNRPGRAAWSGSSFTVAPCAMPVRPPLSRPSPP